jgi:hypothetical protein
VLVVVVVLGPSAAGGEDIANEGTKFDGMTGGSPTRPYADTPVRFPYPPTIKRTISSGLVSAVRTSPTFVPLRSTIIRSLT